MSRLLAALEYLGKVDLKTERGPVVVTVFDQDRIADYQNMVAKLRHAGIRAELYLGSGKFGPQMKYADRRNSPCVVIQGSDEKARGEVTIKDLIVGAELAKLEKGREQHLQKQAEAQRSVPEEKMVEAVRAAAEAEAQWTTTCTATQQQGIPVNAVCMPLEPTPHAPSCDAGTGVAGDAGTGEAESGGG